MQATNTWGRVIRSVLRIVVRIDPAKSSVGVIQVPWR
jgi:hypothetical protein